MLVINFYPPTSRCLRLSEIHKQRAAVVYGKLSHACSDHSPGGTTIFNNKSPLLRSPANKNNKYIVNSITNCWWINTVHNSFDVIWLFLNCVWLSIHLVLRTRWILNQTQLRNNHITSNELCIVFIQQQLVIESIILFVVFIHWTTQRWRLIIKNCGAAWRLVGASVV